MKWEGTGCGGGCKCEANQAGWIVKGKNEVPARRIIDYAILELYYGGLRLKLKIFGKSKSRLPHATWSRKVHVELVTKSWHRIESPGQAGIRMPHSKVLESKEVMTNGKSLAVEEMVRR
jgi:hypothetical protein